MQVPPPQASENGSVASVVGPANVELAGVPKSTWNWNTARLSAPAPSEETRSGEPAGGGVAPSRSDGSRLATSVGASNETEVAGCPASMPDRARAATLAPRNWVPVA